MWKIILEAFGDVIEKGVNSATFQKPLSNLTKYITPPIFALNAFLSTLITAVVILISFISVIFTKEFFTDFKYIWIGYIGFVLICLIFIMLRTIVEDRKEVWKQRGQENPKASP